MTTKPSSAVDSTSATALENNTPVEEGFWNARRVRIATIVGTVAVIAIVAAALLFIPGAPLAIYGTIAAVGLFKLGISFVAAKLILEAAVIFIPTGVAALVYKIGQKILRDREIATVITSAVNSEFPKKIEIAIHVPNNKEYFSDSELREAAEEKIKNNVTLRKVFKGTHYTEKEKNCIRALLMMTTDRFTANEFESKVGLNVKLVDADKDKYEITTDDSGITLTTKKSLFIKESEPGLLGLRKTYGTIELQCVARSEGQVAQKAGEGSSDSLIEGEAKYKLPKKLVVSMLGESSVPQQQRPQPRDVIVSIPSQQKASNRLESDIEPQSKDETQARQRLSTDLRRTGVVWLNGKKFDKDSTADVFTAFEIAIPNERERILALELSSHRLSSHVFTNWANKCMEKDSTLKNPTKITKGVIANIHIDEVGVPIITGSIEAGFIDAKKSTDPHNPHIIHCKKLSYTANVRTGKVWVDITDT